MQTPKIRELESEINQLTQQRAVIFNQWAALVKSNDREYEMTGVNPPDRLKRADDLLAEQKAIGKKIMKLLEKLDNLSLSLD